MRLVKKMSNGFASKFLGLAAATLFIATAAQADEWRVVQTTGDVWIGSSDSAQPVSLGPVKAVPEGARLITGKNGRAMLEHDGQTMLVGPNSVAEVPKNSVQGFTTIVERAGQIEFDVDKQKAPHFAVETPFLAAVVKGTHFTVNVGFEDAAVSVKRGLVGVSDLSTGQTVDTPAGQTAQVSGPDRTLTIAGIGQLASITQGAPRAPIAAPLSASDLATMQSNAASGATMPNISPDKGASQAAGTTVAIGAGGNGGGGAGGAGTGDPGNSASGGTGGGATTLALNGSGASGIPTYTTGSGSNSRYDDSQASSLTPIVVAVAFACAVMVAFGLAFVRGRFG